ncbi:MAG: hypothetical protein SGPRY_011529, partial [Prymnesium sp.]
VLSRTPAVLLTQGSPFSVLLAHSLAEQSKAWWGCSGEWTLHTRALASPYPATNALRHLLVDERSALIYCYVPKAACTSFQMWMRRLAGHKDWLSVSLAHSRGALGEHRLHNPFI